MQAELRKLAEKIRSGELKPPPTRDKTAQCAKVVQAALGLQTMRRKLAG